MRFPDHAFSFAGGCNCGAIRYKVSIPDISERPYHAMVEHPAEDGSSCRQSFVGICHCNNCRRATGSLFWAYMMLRFSEVQVLYTRRSTVTPPDTVENSSWRPASELFTPAGSETDCYLVAYDSSPNRSRYFCSRCGTTIGYAVDKWPAWWKGEPVVDLSLGSVDREYLEKDWMEPERALFWDSGIPWVKRATAEGFKLGERWPMWKPGEELKTQY